MDVDLSLVPSWVPPLRKGIIPFSRATRWGMKRLEQPQLWDPLWPLPVPVPWSSAKAASAPEHPSGPGRENPPQGRATGVRVQPGTWRRCQGLQSPGSPGSPKLAAAGAPGRH